jgi:UDP-N-acetylmuramate dehydrogenase
MMGGLRGKLLRNEPLARHTSWRVGGPADRYYKPADVDDLVAFLGTLPEDEPLLWIGLGSNLLVRDGGIRGTVIATHGVLDRLERLDDERVYAGSGVACAKLARRCAKWGLRTGEFFAGIPGTIGGALAMNAGAFGGETWNHVLAVDVVDRNGRRLHREPEEYLVGYRSVEGPPGEWFLGAEFGFAPGQAGQEEIRDILAKRKATQPIGLPSCGSVFRNPPGDHAARLIEAAGLKGLEFGGARVSEKHANFIISRDGATAADIERLILHVQQTVKDVHGVELIPEVRMAGEDPR